MLCNHMTPNKHVPIHTVLFDHRMHITHCIHIRIRMYIVLCSHFRVVNRPYWLCGIFGDHWTHISRILHIVISNAKKNTAQYIKVKIIVFSTFVRIHNVLYIASEYLRKRKRTEKKYKFYFLSFWPWRHRITSIWFSITLID